LIPETQSPIVEHLQLVHYAEGQQYTVSPVTDTCNLSTVLNFGFSLLGFGMEQPHHDFMIPSLRKGQPTRFATVLFYLNEPEMGGETSFPRWVNGKEHKVLSVTPQVGKAVLFYNQLPDGNYDERSLHAAKP
jgi:hypothetical protein